MAEPDMQKLYIEEVPEDAPPLEVGEDGKEIEPEALPAPQDKEQYTAEKQAKYQTYLDQAKEQKELGNQFFKAKDFRKARMKYARVFPYTKAIMGMSAGSKVPIANGMAEMALKMAKEEGASPDLMYEAKALERDTASNMALVFLKEKNYKKAIEKATYSINVEKSSKAFFRRAQANILKGDFESAYLDFEESKKLDPDSEALIDAEVKKAQKAEKDYDKKEAQRMGKLFG
jgi:tetratricopeptide (TPR) repeat protein